MGRPLCLLLSHRRSLWKQGKPSTVKIRHPTLSLLLKAEIPLGAWTANQSLSLPRSVRLYGPYLTSYREWWLRHLPATAHRQLPMIYLHSTANRGSLASSSRPCCSRAFALLTSLLFLLVLPTFLQYARATVRIVLFR